MVAHLREADRTSVDEPARKSKVNEQTIYAWRKHFGQLEPADVKRLKALTLENAKLKKLLAERDLEIEVMKDINRKNGEPAGSPRAVHLSLRARHSEATRLRAERHGPLHPVVRAAAAGEGRPGARGGAPPVIAVPTLWLSLDSDLPVPRRFGKERLTGRVTLPRFDVHQATQP